MIERNYDNLNNFVKKGKVLVIYGPRRVGKTTLLQNYLKKIELKYKLDSGDNIKIQNLLSSQDFSQILDYAEGYELIAIDEAQQVPNIGMGLKIIVDQIPNIIVIATGSSSFDLANKLGEPLTGRKRTLLLYPIAQLELSKIYNKHELKEKLQEYLIYGLYPEVVTTKKRNEKRLLLDEITQSYLFRDILSMDKIRSSKTLVNLVKLLAFQLGNEVSHNELATNLDIDVKTVQRYLDLLEKSFVIKRLGGLSRNLRKEISTKNKYYFFDNGIRNSIISQFNDLDLRNDVGQLWENFIFIERLKKRNYHNIFGNNYFWRTYDQQEIDFVEERDGMLFGYECKWNIKKKISCPLDWVRNYPNSDFSIINPQNYLDFIL